ncbi:MAG: thermonuclease family protein [Candidatus Omnitrophota bacterium]
MKCPHLKIIALVSLFFLAAPSVVFPKSDTLTVIRASDGDTLKLSNGEKVRLIGIDTPESSNNAKLRRDAKRTGQDSKEIIRMGKEAAAFTRKLVQGKNVTLEFDVRKRDKYGRLLAYVYLEDKTFVNAEIMKAGYAQVMTIPPNVKYQEMFLTMEREAREGKRGLWA